ncbi:hypothetical protein DSUL_20081 [Desulfovibrionales bacterium]
MYNRRISYGLHAEIYLDAAGLVCVGEQCLGKDVDLGLYLLTFFI